MTAGERLKLLSGLAGVTAAAMLLSIGTGATAGELLVSRSGLATATAAEHLLADVAVIKVAATGGGTLQKQPAQIAAKTAATVAEAKQDEAQAVQQSEADEKLAQVIATAEANNRLIAATEADKLITRAAGGAVSLVNGLQAANEAASLDALIADQAQADAVALVTDNRRRAAMLAALLLMD